jgi:hypothetical protein
MFVRDPSVPVETEEEQGREALRDGSGDLIAAMGVATTASAALVRRDDDQALDVPLGPSAQLSGVDASG